MIAIAWLAGLALAQDPEAEAGAAEEEAERPENVEVIQAINERTRQT